MNLLVYDDPPTVGRLVRAALAGQRHRASMTAAPDEALRRLETGLFDALVLGAGGAPRELADRLETDWPELPLILAGVERSIPCVAPIVAVLPRPLRLEALRACLRALEPRTPPGRAPETCLEIATGGRRIACRLVGRARDSLLLEPARPVEPGESAALGAGGVLTVIGKGAGAPATLLFADAAPRGGVRRLAVRVADADDIEKLMTSQPGGEACSRERSLTA
jgi:CheY-like chemotaxis protein